MGWRVRHSFSRMLEGTSSQVGVPTGNSDMALSEPRCVPWGTPTHETSERRVPVEETQTHGQWF